MMKNFLIGCLGLSLLLIVITIGSFVYFFGQTRPQLTSAVDLPPAAEVGKPVEMRVQLTNPHDELVVLDSIDVDGTFLDAFTLLSVDPQPLEEMDLFGQRSFSFSHNVPPGGTATVTYVLEPKTHGRVYGTLDVCNPNQDFNTHNVTIEVSRPAEQDQD